jgi:hypothetical protein
VKPPLIQAQDSRLEDLADQPPSSRNRRRLPKWFLNRLEWESGVVKQGNFAQDSDIEILAKRSDYLMHTHIIQAGLAVTLPVVGHVAVTALSVPVVPVLAAVGLVGATVVAATYVATRNRKSSR